LIGEFGATIEVNDPEVGAVARKAGGDGADVGRCEVEGSKLGEGLGEGRDSGVCDGAAREDKLGELWARGE